MLIPLSVMTHCPSVISIPRCNFVFIEISDIVSYKEMITITKSSHNSLTSVPISVVS